MAQPIARLPERKGTRVQNRRSLGAFPSRPISSSGATPRPTTFPQPPPADFRVGRPDRTLFPHRTWKRLVEQRLHGAPLALTEYGDPLGLCELRRASAEHVRVSRGILCAPDQVLIVAGVQEGLNLVSRLLLQPGSAALVENPTYASVAHVFASDGATLIGCEVAEEGLNPRALPRAGARLAYVTPSHQFRLGPTMSLENRIGLLEWARRTGSFVVEDDYDGDFRYQGSPLMARGARDRSERVNLPRHVPTRWERACAWAMQSCRPGSCRRRIR